MPGAFAHYLTARRALTGGAGPIEASGEQRRAYNLGAQGPDIFYYFRAWPWTPTQRLAWLADALHAQHVRRFYQEAAAYTRAAASPQRPTLTAYLCGYACHHALDAAAHPYVLYNTGDHTRPGAEGQRSARRHASLEATLDALLVQRETGHSPAWLVSQRLFEVDAPATAAISEMYAAVIPRVFGRSLPAGRVRQAIADAQHISSLLFDCGPSLTWAFVSIVAALERSGRVRSARYRRLAAGEPNPLNLDRQPWLLPWDDSAPQHSSFLDILDAAVADAQRMISVLASAIANNAEARSAALDNRSFDTGLDCNAQQPLRFFETAVAAGQQR